MFDPDFINGLKQSFGVLSDNLRETDKRFFLLWREEHSAEWVVNELTSAYKCTYVKDTFRNTIHFTSFSIDAGFPDIFAQATHCAWGIPDADNEINLYYFDANQKTLADADGLSPLHSAAAFRATNERFEIPA